MYLVGNSAPILLIELVLEKKSWIWKGDLKNFVQFLYDDEIHSDNVTDYYVILNNLSLGFPEDMHLRHEKKFLDENPDGSCLCEDID